MIRTVPLEEYVRDVQPQSYALWGGGRDVATYRADLERVAGLPYIAHTARFTIGLDDGGVLACSCKRFEREVRWGCETLAAVGIGAVFTPEPLRGRGYASLMLGALLDEERAHGRDLAYLFSDIHPVFYERLGFHTLPSRTISVRAAGFDARPTPIVPIEPDDWTCVRSCFDASDDTRTWAFTRPAAVWDWIRTKWSGERPHSQSVRLMVRRGTGALAYAMGRRVPRQNAFVVDDFGFAGEEGRAVLPSLLRAATGDLTRITGWLPPPGGRQALGRGSTRPRRTAILMVVPLSRRAREWWTTVAPGLGAQRGDPVWAADHI